jgi:alpha-glucosidase
MNVRKLTVIIFLLTAKLVYAQDYSVLSPDGKLEIAVTIGAEITYTVSHMGTPLVTPSSIGLTLGSGQVIGANATVASASTRSVSDVIRPLYGKQAEIADEFNEQTIVFNDNYSLLLRAYDQGVAYRFVTSIAGNVIVNSETATFNLSGTPGVIFPEADAALQSWERSYYTYNAVTEIAVDRFAITPTLFSFPSGIRLVIAEADLLDYPGMYVQRTATGMKGKWAAYPATVSDPDNIYSYHRVLARENFIANTTGTREYPWRVIIVSDDDKQLLDNQLIYTLATPSVLTNTSYIKPGKSAWEWWHDAILETTAIPSGPNNLSFDLYKYYVDFAAKNKLEYITMDAGWKTDFASQVCQYAATKSVKVILWDFINLPVENPLRLAQLKAIGAAGVKVDLIERDDQVAINWVRTVAQRCADNGLMLVLHGCGKPTGLQRMYPNIMNFEAVRGAECDKWDNTANPDYHLQFPFIRMLAGPLDYTPGSMRNVHPSQFSPTPAGIPMSMGTRAHELAMYIVFDQYLGYLCDSPTEYSKFPDVTRFLAAVPASWDRTIPLAAEVGKYAVVAKQIGANWFVGAMTNNEARDIEIDFSFLPEGPHFVEVLRDNELTEANAKVMTHEIIEVNNLSKVNVHLASAGGATFYVNDLITGIESENQKSFNVYLNAERTQLTIESDAKLQTVFIADISGRVHYSGSPEGATKTVIDVSTLKPGQLFVVFGSNATRRYSAKFIR